MDSRKKCIFRPYNAFFFCCVLPFYAIVILIIATMCYYVLLFKSAGISGSDLVELQHETGSGQRRWSCDSIVPQNP